ncbi:Cysteine-rich receptor-like protein kinase 10 [Linum perenne]
MMKPIEAVHFLFISCLLRAIFYTNASYLPSSTCELNTNYTSGSPYQRSLNLTLSSLAANVSRTGYMTTSSTAGQGADDTAYGLLQCRGYTTTRSCQTCADSLTTRITKLCPNQKEASIFDDDCTLQYADWNFFSTADVFPRVNMYSPNNATDPVTFYSHLNDLLENLSSVAADSASRLAFGGSKYSGSRYVYAMVQCTLDISGDDCLNCLHAIAIYIPSSTSNRDGGRLFALSCNLRFESYSFFQSLPPPSDGNNSTNGDGKNSKRIVTLVIIPVLASVAVVVLISAVIYLFLHARASSINPDGGEIRGKSFLFSLDALKTATMDFDSENKLGEGGFGPVYKGNLPDGQDIAVKRLSTSSKLNPEDLRTEVMLIAKLMHKNLVRLLGFCFEEEEKMLVYEYLPNGSLDEILHDPNRRFDLDWGTRYKIITGIARGMLYLHEDSQLTIIHRGLKSSNILLDASMTPKIADFGLARVFLGSEGTQIAETNGYMAPEYAENGQFSVKSDVYSFGILLLEIVTGQRSSETRDSVNLQSDVWDHWSNGMALNLRDPTMGDRFANTEVLKCIHIGLLCVQESVAVRPTMSEVVMMLSSHTVTYPTPLKPGFFVNR